MSNLGRLVACASLLLVFPLHAAQLPDAPAGAVRFYNVADSDFDVYSQSPSTSAQQWMRSHYVRMQTYTPYFDTRLSWYPAGWAYKNIFGVAVGSTVAVQHPEWLLRDASGNLLYIDWGCSSGRCPLYAADFGNAAYRTYWVSEAKALIAKGYKGLWIDDVDMDFRTSNGSATRVIPSDPRTGQAMTLTNWRRYMAEILEQVRAAIPGAELAHNAIWYAANSLTDGYIRRQIDAADYINLERGATDGGLVYGSGQWGFETFLAYVDFIHARGRSVIMMDYGTTTTDREFGLAGMLLANQGRDMLSSNQLAWTAPDRWWSGYDTHLGESNGLRYKWNGLLRRDFQCGMVLANQPGASSISVALPSAFTTLEGTQVTSVTLGARQAKVLKSACTEGGILDEADNCTLEENPTQCDSDGDGYGNRCDGDLDNNTFTNAQDDILFRAQLGQASVAPTYNEADLNCNAFVNAEDYILFRSRLGTSSGPSGLHP